MPRFLRRDIIPHDLIHNDLGDMRVFHDAVKDEELTESIKALGIRNPITLRPHPSKTGEYQLVDGRRRRRCNEIAGNNSIQAEVHEMTRLEACLIAFTENVQRDDPDSVGLGFWLSQIEKNDQTIKTQEDLAKTVHKSQSWVSRQLSAYNQALEAMKKEEADLDEEAVDIGVLQNSAPTERHARALRRATDAVQERVIEMTQYLGEPPSARSIERMIKAKNTPQEILEKHDPRNTLFDNAYIAYELMEKAGLTVTVATRMTKSWRQFTLPWQKLETTVLSEPRQGDKEVQLYKKLSEIYPTEVLDIIDSVAPAKTFDTMTKYCRRFISKLMLAVDDEVKQTVLDDFKEG